jgi:1,4-dihydroxy-2-naphthoyl-CoA synthase
LRDTFRALVYADDVDVVVFLPNGGNFCSGGDVHDIIGPLTKMDMKGLLNFTRMTGDLVKAMIGCGKPIISAVDGVAVGAGAIITMASDLRLPRRRRRPPSCSPASALPVATWVRAPCCRGSSARAARLNCSTPAAP